MNYIGMINKIEAILQAAKNRPKRKKAGAKGLLAPRENSMASKKATPADDGEPPTEILLARYIGQIRKAKAEMKKAMQKENKDA
jgi:hypothetical protein